MEDAVKTQGGFGISRSGEKAKAAIMGLGPSPAKKEKTLSFSHRHWCQAPAGHPETGSHPECAVGPLGQTGLHPNHGSFSLVQKWGGGIADLLYLLGRKSPQPCGMGRVRPFPSSYVSSAWNERCGALWPSPRAALLTHSRDRYFGRLGIWWPLPGLGLSV